MKFITLKIELEEDDRSEFYDSLVISINDKDTLEILRPRLLERFNSMITQLQMKIDKEKHGR